MSFSEPDKFGVTIDRHPFTVSRFRALAGGTGGIRCVVGRQPAKRSFHPVAPLAILRHADPEPGPGWEHERQPLRATGVRGGFGDCKLALRTQ